MKTISFSDTIFATVINCGTAICRLTLRGVTSISEVVAAVRRQLGVRANGMVTLEVRNSTQGWSMRNMLRLTAPEGLQLTLF